jgi:hypothetical protein
MAHSVAGGRRRRQLLALRTAQHHSYCLFVVMVLLATPWPKITYTGRLESAEMSQNTSTRSPIPAPLPGRPLSTTKMNDVDPQAWVADVLVHIAGHPATGSTNCRRGGATSASS